MSFELVLGILALGYGLYTIYVRVSDPDELGKLGAMREQWGRTAGTVIHVIAYTVVPIVVGLVLVARALGSG